MGLGGKEQVLLVFLVGPASMVSYKSDMIDTSQLL